MDTISFRREPASAVDKRVNLSGLFDMGETGSVQFWGKQVEKNTEFNPPVSMTISGSTHFKSKRISLHKHDDMLLSDTTRSHFCLPLEAQLK